jgi:hypothetical protein
MVMEVFDTMSGEVQMVETLEYQGWLGCHMF